MLDANLFPRYIDPFENEEIKAVAPPDTATLSQPGVREAAGSVVKILGEASCQRGIEGSGFAYAPDRIMTNAHVVAGVSDPSWSSGSSPAGAPVVVFDPKLDVAVLRVDGLRPRPRSTSTRPATRVTLRRSLASPRTAPSTLARPASAV